MECLEGYIELPIKSFSKESIKQFEEDASNYEIMGKDPSELNEEDYSTDGSMFVRPEQITSYKPSDDGYTDITTASLLDFTRVYITPEEFIKLVKTVK